MQHDHVLKKLNFDLLSPTAGSRRGLLAKYLLIYCSIWGGGGGNAGKILATMLLHLVIPFNLISNMTML